MPDDSTPAAEATVNASHAITRKLGEVLERCSKLEAENTRLRDENQHQAAELRRLSVKLRDRSRSRSRS